MIETIVGGYVTREGTTDANAVYALANDEYGLVGRTLTGWAIDIGAHIGTVAIRMARLNPGLRVLAVEAVPENYELLRRNIERADVPVTPIHAWAARPGTLTGTCHYGYRHRETEDDSYVAAHRFVGNTWVDRGEPEFSVEIMAVSLDVLLQAYGIDDVSLLKIDCEGCEWAFLDTPAVARVRMITGEYHGGYPGHPDHQPEPIERMTELLSATHEVTILDPGETVVGMFQAVRR